jgi:butyryl-CoA dehydrogenase
LEGNSLAIQIHGGYGYTRDFPVEQYWRDQRLNMIHEGTHGIQAMDLLGRKVLLEDGRGLKLLSQHMLATVAQAQAAGPAWGDHATALKQAVQQISDATHATWAGGDPALALANAVPYMQAFGHAVIAWVWLQVAMASQGEGDANLGRRQACQFFFHYELPKIGAWLNVVNSRDSTCADMPEGAF